MDIDILDMVAAKTGKENIVVKLHPRSTYNRFSRRGYSVMAQENVPWEIYALNENLDNRVYISNSSTAAFSPRIIFGSKTPCINLYKLDLIEKSLYTRQKDFSKVYSLQENLFNESEPSFFAPNNINELNHILTYLEINNRKQVL